MSHPLRNAHDAYWFLAEHPQRGHLDSSFIHALDVSVMKIDPLTRRVEDDPARNTEMEIWLESGPGYTDPAQYHGAYIPIHDWKLDCGGPTFEAALIQLAEKVRAQYGDYPVKKA